jgi:uncharacterized protein RhaS with RHS repeats
VNLYGYVNNNPIRYIDPLGLDATTAGIGLGLGAGAAASSSPAVAAAIVAAAPVVMVATAGAGAYYIGTKIDQATGASDAIASVIIWATSSADEDEEALYKPKGRECKDKKGGEDNDPFKGKGPKRGTPEYEKARRLLEDLKKSTGRGGRDNPPSGDNWY